MGDNWDIQLVTQSPGEWVSSYSTHVTISRKFYEIAYLSKKLPFFKPKGFNIEEDKAWIEKSVVVAT